MGDHALAFAPGGDRRDIVFDNDRMYLAASSSAAAGEPSMADRATITGVPAEDIRQAARMYAQANRAAFYWGMGISQSVHGTDNALLKRDLEEDGIPVMEPERGQPVTIPDEQIPVTLYVSVWG